MTTKLNNEPDICNYPHMILLLILEATKRHRCCRHEVLKKLLKVAVARLLLHNA